MMLQAFTVEHAELRNLCVLSVFFAAADYSMAATTSMPFNRM